MTNAEYCTLYTSIAESAEAALQAGFTTGFEYSIAGRKFTANNISELSALALKYRLLAERYCNGNGGIKCHRVVPID